MARQLRARHLRCDHLEQSTGSAWSAGADGVAQRHFIAAHVVQLAGHRRDLFGSNRPVIRTAQNAGDIAAYAHTVFASGLHDWHKTLQAVADRAVDVALGEGLSGRSEHRDLFHAGRQRILEAAQVRCQGRVGDAALLTDIGKHLS
ncbi:hypothetical protein D3C78_889890 [compost metagenome]